MLTLLSVKSAEDRVKSKLMKKPLQRSNDKSPDEDRQGF